jgi:hypothetical protein
LFQGTNGIQSIDLLGRKISMQNGLGYSVLQRKIRASIEEAKKSPNSTVRDAAERVEAALTRHIETTQVLFQKHKSDPAGLLANSHEYLNFTGHVIVSWIWLKQGIIAANALKDTDISPRDVSFYVGKLFGMRFFCEQELVKTESQATLLKSNPQTNVEMKNGFF